MLDKLNHIIKRWEEIGKQLNDPHFSGSANQQSIRQLTKEYKHLSKIVSVGQQYKETLSNIDNNKQILNTEKDEEIRLLAKEELEILEAKKSELEKHLYVLLIPKEPEDEKNAIMEIRAGTGGDEASLFAGDLYRMYIRYCETKGWKTEIMSESPGTMGGYKEVIFHIIGEGAYGMLKYESGVHRVQRVPVTEQQGRIHTSAASVVVLPEADDLDVTINPNDIRKDTFRSSGAGGQHVNKVETAVRLTHIPTGVVVECQQERSQFQNYERAMRMLRTKIYEIEYNKRAAEAARKRKTFVSTGDRSAKIRTYNFPQGRVTDHRIGLTLYNLEAILDGDLSKLIQALQMAEEKAILES